MCNWQVAAPRSGPCACPLTIIVAAAADALAAVVIERDRLLAGLDELLVELVHHLQERHAPG